MSVERLSIQVPGVAILRLRETQDHHSCAFIVDYLRAMPPDVTERLLLVTEDTVGVIQQMVAKHSLCTFGWLYAIVACIGLTLGDTAIGQEMVLAR